MAKPKYTRRARITMLSAVALHAEANKSDPFAAKRMAMTLRNGADDLKEVAKESQRIIGYRADRTKRNGCADWCDPVTEARLSLHKTYLTVRRPRDARGRKLSTRAILEQAA